MVKLCNINGRLIIKFVENLGYSFERQKGSHMRYKNEQGNAITIHVKGKKIMKPGKLKGLLNDLNQTPEQLISFMMKI